ncbi:polyprenyl synthetase family protein [Intrasporangium oryzae]|uniref:polyprenyl synthetase family protein n=1 Tax=Intrasporangium oryzae TaxID=412687 RepID=UPI00146F94B2|nr:polyprenyl synthetase family protein [Intrasporangium oryzae]
MHRNGVAVDTPPPRVDHRGPRQLEQGRDERGRDERGRAEPGRPGQGGPDRAEPARTMDAIDGLLREVCDDIALGWAERVPESADILPADLPETLLTWLLPASGKRLRPLMCHWGWVTAHGAVDGAGHDDMVRAAAALELLHLFALVHDDVMDRGASRRGRETVHVAAAKAHAGSGALGDSVLFGDSVAILLGDLALSEASILISGTPRPLLDMWREMLRELVHGQLLDITAAAARRRDLEHSRRVARLKSGAYTIQRPLLLGALAAGAGPETLCALAAYGDHLGEAFALRDDVLGVWGDPAATGKPVGDDLLAAKATVLLAEARRLLPPATSERYLGPASVITPDDVPELQRLMVEVGVLDEVESRITDEVARALDALDDRGLHPDGVRSLTELAHATAWRSA